MGHSCMFDAAVQVMIETTKMSKPVMKMMADKVVLRPGMVMMIMIMVMLMTFMTYPESHTSGFFCTTGPLPA